MFVHYRTQALILKKKNQGEADQLFTIYSKEFGKLEVLGRGIRKISSKLRPGMEKFCLSEIEFIQGKTYRTLTDAILIDKFRSIRDDLAKLDIAYRITRVLDDSIYGQEPDPRVWNLLLEIFKILNNNNLEAKGLKLIYYHYLWSLISILGYRCELYHCAVCEEKLIPKDLYFVPEEGGVICQNCFKKRRFGKKINPEIVKILRVILKRDLRIILRLKIKKEHLRLLEEVCEDYFSFCFK